MAYVEKEKLGEGGFGTVYKATRRSDGAQVAIKRLKLSDPTSINEIKMLRHVEHGNIVAYLGHFKERGCLCIVMELCEGGTLQERIDRQRDCHSGIPISLQKIHPWFKQTVGAIEYLHSRHIMHRDIKPANILIKEGKVRVADFGISKQVAETGAHAYTQIGTFFYMSPEVYCGLPYTMKCDIWSLGVLLYVLAELNEPFQTGKDVLRGSYHSLEDSDNPDELIELIEDMLQVDAQSRPSIHAVVAHEFVASSKDRWHRSS